MIEKVNEKYGYIYLVTNTINNKKYIGKHKSKSFDHLYFGSGKLIKEALKTYGKKNFKIEIIEWCSTKEELCEKERYWVNYFNCAHNDDYYNLYNGSCGSTEVSQETKLKLSRAFSGDKNPSKRPDVREKIRQSKLGENNAMYGKHPKLSDETKEKLRKANLGRKMSLESRKKMSEAKIGKPSNRKRKVVIDGVEYESVSEALSKLNMSTKRLYKILNEQNKDKEM